MSKLLINIDVPDLTRAERFYGAALGLTVARRLGGGAVELQGLDVPLYLLCKLHDEPPFPHATARRDYQRHWTPVHFDIVVEDITSAVARAVEAGAVMESDVVEKSWGKIALLADPFGHGFCLLEFVRSGYDEIAN